MKYFVFDYSQQDSENEGIVHEGFILDECIEVMHSMMLKKQQEINAIVIDDVQKTGRVQLVEDATQLFVIFDTNGEVCVDYP